MQNLIEFDYLAPNTHLYPSAHVKSQAEVETFKWVADRGVLSRLVAKISALRGEPVPQYDSVTVTLYEDREYGDCFCIDYKLHSLIQTFFRVSKELIIVTGIPDWSKYDGKSL